MPVSANCEHCGSTFSRPPSAMRGNNGKFCSRSCYFKARTVPSGPSNPGYKRIDRNCEICGTTFQAKPAVVQKGHGRYCSHACSNEAKRRVTGKDHPLHKPEVSLTCEWCGAKYTRRRYHSNRSRYCSSSCRATHLAKQRGKRSRPELRLEATLEKSGIRFEAQRQVGSYLVDFFLPNEQLVVEVDGVYWHGKPRVIERDARKTEYCESIGLQVIRIPAEDIQEGVLPPALLAACRNHSA